MLAELFPLAALITPNKSETELLLSCSVETLEDMLSAARDLPLYGPRALARTSDPDVPQIHIFPSAASAESHDDDDTMNWDSHISGADTLGSTRSRASPAETTQQTQQLVNDAQIELGTREQPRPASSLDLSKPDYLRKRPRPTTLDGAREPEPAALAPTGSRGTAYTTAAEVLTTEHDSTASLYTTHLPIALLAYFYDSPRMQL
ncbi:hypothetical protein B0H10DRAFT_2207949 [Mycena sp. CBHHK59/15]|nr:hypothetical protein B0H10DRAFT_2207949 [Mycena sp. CBHHK59/15]